MSLNKNRLKEEVENLKSRLRVKRKPVETSLDTNSYSLISKPINLNPIKENISIRTIKYPPTKKYKIKNRMILTKKKIETNLISFDIPIEMSNEIALLLLENNPKNMYDLKTAKCIKPGAVQKPNSKGGINFSTSYSKAENLLEKDR